MLAIVSNNDVVGVSLGVCAASAWSIAKRAAGALHLQHFCLSLTSQAGFEHWSSHFGRGHVVGLAHDQLQDVSSHSGAQFAFGATHVVWH